MHIFYDQPINYRTEEDLITQKNNVYYENSFCLAFPNLVLEPGTGSA